MTTPKTFPIVQPYLFFEGSCDAALGFYKEKLGAEVTALMRYKDGPEPTGDCGTTIQPDKVMHAAFRIGETVLMASDGQCSGKPNFSGFALTLTVKDIPASERAFAALSDGGQVIMPLGKTFYSPSFGMVTDRFGLMWMVIVMAETCP
jgi:PhnB protein